MDRFRGQSAASLPNLRRSDHQNCHPSTFQEIIETRIVTKNEDKGIAFETEVQENEWSDEDFDEITNCTMGFASHPNSALTPDFSTDVVNDLSPNSDSQTPKVENCEFSTPRYEWNRNRIAVRNEPSRTFDTTELGLRSRSIGDPSSNQIFVSPDSESGGVTEQPIMISHNRRLATRGMFIRCFFLVFFLFF